MHKITESVLYTYSSSSFWKRW